MESFTVRAVDGRRRIRRARWPAVAFVLSGLLVWGVGAAAAQETGQVVGEVTAAETMGPLAQVQVLLTDTGMGTLTNSQGQFTIGNVPPGTYELRAERLGYGTATQEVTVGANETVTVELQLQRQALGLDEVVVTGTAGAARRREIGNTISQINVGDLPDRPVNLSDALTASAPGVDVTIAGGEIGQGSRIQLRGQNSLSMTNQPIIYIDGVRMMAEGTPPQGTLDVGNRGANVTSSPLDQLNPNDIERIEIIKGSAATTLYGTEASAGVIQIFTKSGSAGAPIWTLETQQGTLWSRAFGVSGSERVEPHANYNFMTPFMRSGWLGLGEGDWGTAHNQMYSASVQGGGEALQYFISGQMRDEVGLQPNDFGETWAFRGNFTFTPISDLRLQANAAYSNQELQNTPSGNNAEGVTLNAFRQERNYFGTGERDALLPLLEQQLDTQLERYSIGITTSYAPTPNLTQRFTVGHDFTAQEHRNVRGFGNVFHPQGLILNDTYQKRLLTFDYVGTYRFEISDAIRSSFSWGGQAAGDEERRLRGWGDGFPGVGEPTVSSAASTLGFEDRQKIWNAGFFFQNVFDLQDKYFVTVGARVDGNSAFGEGFGLQFYPKASAAWVVSDEDFWDPGLGELRLRAAYGQSGRAPGAFDAVRTWDSEGLAGQPAFVPGNLGNPDLGPEVSAEIEVGFDGSFRSGRVTTEVTYYHQTTSDALLNFPQVPSAGFTQSQLLNIGKVRNSGLELGLNTVLLQRPQWGWDLGVNFSTSENEVLDLGGLPETPSLAEGLPLRPMVTWLVTNPDEVADPEFEANHFYGPTHPTRILSLNTTVSVPRGIQLSARGEYRGGHYINHGVFSIGRSVRSPLCFPHYVDPHLGSDLALKPETTALWRARCTPQWGRGYVWDASYFKLRSVTASAPVDFLFPEQVTNAVFTVALNNSYLWMKEMPFMDPELLPNAGINAQTTGFTERVPAPITLRASLRITF